jgi:RNA polymerase sigma-70 factor (ECF subfamily)
MADDDESDPDRDLLEILRAGEPTRALELLMQRHGRAVYRYCRHALHDATLADDTHQHVFIQAHRDLPSFRGGSTVRTWLFAIARHRVLDAAKSRDRTNAHFEDDDSADIPDPRPPPDEQIDEAALITALSGCLAELPERSRTAVVLRHLIGFTYEEMAVICGERPGTLQARVTRALAALRACILARTRHAS